MDQAGVIEEGCQPRDGSGSQGKPNVDRGKGEASADFHEPR